MPKNPRDPKNVKKLIADAEQRKADKGLLAYLARVIAGNEARAKRDRGTRKNPRNGNGQ